MVKKLQCVVVDGGGGGGGLIKRKIQLINLGSFTFLDFEVILIRLYNLG